MAFRRPPLNDYIYYFVHKKNTAFAFPYTGVWHNPRIKSKSSTYRNMYRRLPIYSQNISCQTYVYGD